MTVRFVSLGCNCTCVRHLHWNGLKEETLPFDTCFTDHAVLLKALDTKFEGFFSGDIQVECRQSHLKWLHLSDEDLASLRATFQRRVHRFCSLTGTGRIIFLRYQDDLKLTDESLKTQYDEIRQSLTNFGFDGYRLIFVVRDRAIPHEDFIAAPDLYVHGCWDASRTAWSELLARLVESERELFQSEAKTMESASLAQPMEDLTIDDGMDLLLEHSRSARWRGTLDAATHRAALQNLTCGDEVSLQLEVGDGIIRAIRYEGRGCLISQAAASLLCERLEGEPLFVLSTRSARELFRFDPRQVRVNRRRCVLLAWEALTNMLKNGSDHTSKLTVPRQTNISPVSALPDCHYRCGEGEDYCLCEQPLIAEPMGRQRVPRSQCLSCPCSEPAFDLAPFDRTASLLLTENGLHDRSTVSTVRIPSGWGDMSQRIITARMSAPPVQSRNGMSPVAALPPPCPRVNHLQVLTCLFNPARSRKIERNFQIFRECLGNIPITVVELVLDDDPPMVDDAIQLRGTRDRHCLWQKERLLNIGLESLPAEVDAVAWLDADVLLPASWYDETIAALENALVVQPYHWAHWLDEEERIEHSFVSYSKWRGERQVNVYGHPGFGWAAHRSVLKQGFFDRHIVGGGDAWMCYAFDGDTRPVRWPSPPAPRWLIEEFDKWSDGVCPSVAGQMAHLGTDLLHLNHGKHSDRGYHQRAHWMMETKLQANQIVLDDNGLYTVVGNDRFRRKMIDYFPSRRDGG